MHDILHDFNNAQRDAVTSDAAVLQVLAPPGSGKTKTLTARVAHLIAQRHLKPWNIIVCTFTVKAANEMKERIENFIGYDLAKRLKLGTFHSVALQYLRRYGQHVGLDKDFGIADSSDSKAIVAKIIKSNAFTIEAGPARSRISVQKSKGVSSELFLKSAKNMEQQEFARIYAEYDATLQASNLLDYDDLLLRCCTLINAHPTCVSNVEAVLIDEFQDTNKIQYDLMSLFAQQRNNITIVGDPDQSIYGFRSAEIENLARMKRGWPDTITVNLSENYRSSGAILHAAQRIIEQDECRPPKKLQATHSYGLQPVLRKLPCADMEADWLVSEVKRLQALTGDMLHADDFAVLLRSAALSRTIESALAKAGVPYRMVGGTRFYDRVEVKLILDYLRVVDQPNNSQAVERIINMPPRRIGKETVKALRDEAIGKRVTLWQLIVDAVQGGSNTMTKISKTAARGLDEFVNVIMCAQKKLRIRQDKTPCFASVINLLIQKLKLAEYLKRNYADDFDARLANIEELLAQAAEASSPEKIQSMLEDQVLPEIEGFEQRTTSVSSDALSMFLASIALTNSNEQSGGKTGEKLHQLTISTIHAAKGLEWPVVFLPACFDGSIPHSRAEDTNEERRLLYVGMTRAQAILYLSCPLKNSKLGDTSMSKFLTQPGLGAYFSEHGPSISYNDVANLARTLRRECPSAHEVLTAKARLDRDEDNYWPLNGESPLGESERRDCRVNVTSALSFGILQNASRSLTMNTTMQQLRDSADRTTNHMTGFVRASTRYEELLEQSALHKIGRKSGSHAANGGEERTTSRKRQIEGQQSIGEYFTKDEKAASERDVRERVPAPLPTAQLVPYSSLRPLNEISRNTAGITHSAGMNKRQRVPQYKPRIAALHERSTISPPHEQDDSAQYVFLSSSPGNSKVDESHPADPGTANDRFEDGEIVDVPNRAVATFHTTSVQMVTTRRKTLGMRRSLQGWSSRQKPR